MWNFMNRINRFMWGRNGIDKLTLGMLWVYIGIAVVNVFVRSLTGSSVLYLLQWILLILMIFRCLSKNLNARRRENAAFSRILDKLKNSFGLLKRRIKDIKLKRYRRCPKCRAVARLPIKRGRHSVRCPACGSFFNVFIAI